MDIPDQKIHTKICGKMITEINSFVGFRESIIKNEVHDPFKEVLHQDLDDFVTTYYHSLPIKRYQLIQSLSKDRDSNNKNI